MCTPRTNHRGPGQFDTTQWSLVARAAGDQNRSESREALATLCQRYWFPLYAYARRHAPDAGAAEDQTQEFFLRLLEKNLLTVADPHRGRFRSFLLTSFKNFLANQWQRAGAQKRGAGIRPINLDFAAASSRFSQALAEKSSPQQLYEREWAIQLLDQVLDRLGEEYRSRGKEKQFDELKEFIGGLPADQSYQHVARQLGINEGAARVAASRLRSRYRGLVREEVARTLADPGEVDDEIRLLFAALQ